MAQDYFEFPVAYDPDSGQLVTGAEFEVFAEDDTTFQTPLTVTDPVSGATIDPLTSTSVGVLPSFAVDGDPETVILKSGSFTSRVVSWKGRKGDPGQSAYEQAVAGGYQGTEEDFTAAISEAGSWVTSGSVVDGHLQLGTADGSTFDAGSVEGPAGPQGPGLEDATGLSDGLVMKTDQGEWVTAPWPADGAPGADGKQLELRTTSTFVQWRYVGDSVWQNLIDLSQLHGTDAANIQMQVDGGYIQYKLTTDTEWTDLVSVDDLKGQDGAPAAEVQMRVADGYFQYKLTTDTAWTNLIATGDIGGGNGNTVFYTGSAWPARPSTDNPVTWNSRKYSAAPSPESSMQVGDDWCPHPDYLESL